MRSLSALRHRFLLAMGLPAAVACAKTTEHGPPPGGSATVASSVATSSDPPPASATASASASVSAVASVVPPAPSGASGHPSPGGCGSVDFCVSPSATGARAPAPFEKCALTAPADLEGSSPHHEGTFDAELTKARRAMTGGTCCYRGPRAFCGGGRPIRDASGEVLLANLVPNWDWCDRELVGTRAPGDAERAARFLEDARYEHASVASFARASLVLLGLGAPPELVRDAHVAALDEVRHARAFLALAVRRGAPAMSPAPLPLETDVTSDVARFVADTFADGCVGEAMASLDLRARAEAADDPVERGVLSRIADDEVVHAELAWKMIAWAVLTRGGREALERALAALNPAEALVRDVVRPCALRLLELTPPCGEGATPGETSSAPTR